MTANHSLLFVDASPGIQSTGPRVYCVAGSPYYYRQRIAGGAPISGDVLTDCYYIVNPALFTTSCYVQVSILTVRD